MTKNGKGLKVRHEFFNKTDFIGVAGFNSSKSDEKNSNMSNRANIGNSVETFDRRFLHREGKQTRKDSFRRCTMRINFFKMLRTVINRFSDRVININSCVSGAPEAVRKELRMIPRAERMHSGELFRCFNGTDKFMSSSILGFIIEGASGNHFKTCKAKRDAFRGKRERRN